MGTTHKYDSTDDINALQKLTYKGDELIAQMTVLKKEVEKLAGPQLDELKAMYAEREKLDEPIRNRIAMILDSGGTAEDLTRGGIDPGLAHKLFRAHKAASENPLGALLGLITGDL